MRVLTRAARCLFAAVAFLAAALSPAAAVDPPYMLINADSGTVIAERSSGEPWLPASLTKLMTVYLMLEALESGRLRPESPVVMTASASREPPSRMGFPEGTAIRIDTALLILIVKSANDVAAAVAETLAGSQADFVAEMNRRAAQLGMTGTRFVNPHGLPAAGQRTTARDMAVLARAIWVRFPAYRSLFAVPAILYGGDVMRSGNSLLGVYAGASGMKTGFTCAAGYNIAVSAGRGATNLILVLLGERSFEARGATAAAILDQGFATPLAFGFAPRLDTFTPAATLSSPPDMRSTACPNGVISDDIIDDGTVPPGSVAIVTGGADMTTRFDPFVAVPARRPPVWAEADILGTGIEAAVGSAPIPRPRPGFR